MLDQTKTNNEAIIKVIGIGGGGNNSIEYMSKDNIDCVDFFAINTDIQALKKITTSKTIQIGNNTTKGLGAGSNPDIGKNSAEEDKEIIKNIINGADMIFIAAGMGGGTGTGAAPIIAEISKELGILTIAVVTKPFSFEGKKRIYLAEQGIISLSKNVDSLIIIPNDKLLKVLDKEISLIEAFDKANNILKNAVQGISELITKPGLINVDFADVKTVMSEMGYAIIGSGFSSNSDNRAKDAINAAISSPLLEDVNLSKSQGVLVNITAGINLTLDEFETIGNSIKEYSSDDSTIVIGTSLNSDMNDELKITIIATGIEIKKNINKKKNNKIFNFVNKKNKFKNINTITNIKNNKKNNLYIPSFLRKK